MIRTLVIAAVSALFIAAPAAARIDANSFSGLAFRQHPGAQLPIGTRFMDETGRATTLGASMGGRPSVLVLEYLRCQNLCSLVLAGTVSAIQRGQLLPGKDINLVAVSIDPRDTTNDAAKLSAMYSRRFADASLAAQGIHFLTGSPAEVRKLADAVGFPFKLDRQSDQYAHPAGFVVTTSDGRISRYMLGLNPPAAGLREAVAEARRGAVTPAAHPLLLLCFG
ncbi:MAG TPA: SCO family protein, partial [Sphingomicrobium sp.]|nr:SCO family protein [Sphingomicrobium sp.]